MANLITDAAYQAASTDQGRSYPLTDALQVYGGSLLALASTGYLVKWADTAGLKFIGPSYVRALGDTSATGVGGLGVEASVDVRGGIYRRVTVTGASAITDHHNAKVYCSTDNIDDATLTPTVNVGAIGEVVRWHSGTTCDIKLYTPEQYAANNKDDVWTFQLDLASIADGDVITGFTPGFAGRIVDMDFIVNVPVTTGGDGTTLNAEIGTTNLTGGTITLTSANCTPQGAIIAASAITAGNHFDSSDTISVEASSTTAFAEGSGTLVIRYVAD